MPFSTFRADSNPFWLKRWAAVFADDSFPVLWAWTEGGARKKGLRFAEQVGIL